LPPTTPLFPYTTLFRSAKRCLGPNIAQRSQTADQRSEIGHWELDTVQGQKNGNDSVVLVMTDRLSRVNITSKIAGKTAHAVNQLDRKSTRLNSSHVSIS